MKQLSFVSAMLDYFGKNGKDSQAFMLEMKALTPDDRQWFRDNLPSVGYQIIDHR
jgi:hypothetical protein